MMRSCAVASVLVILGSVSAPSGLSGADATISRPRVVRVGMVATDIVAVTINEGSVELGKLVPYEPKEGDSIKEDGGNRKAVIRGGREIGFLAGPEGRSMLRLPDRFVGDRVNRQQLGEPSQWSIPGYAIRKVTYLTRVLDAAQVVRGDWKVSFEYIVFLHLQESLPEGRHTVRFTPLGAFEFDWDDAVSISPAIHVSAIGFRPDDPGKRATLSCWPAEGLAINYLQRRPDLKYRVVNHQTGDEVLAGSVTLKQAAEDPDDYLGLRGRPNGIRANRVGGPVFALDLTELVEPGSYRVIVDGVGASKPFRIARDVYDPVWQLALRGLHAHRRNVDLMIQSVDGERWKRPGADDSGAVYSSARMGNATFDAFVKGATDRPAPDTRGGWMDAGDFDSNHNHHWVSLLLLDLMDRHPTALKSDNVGISDSGNGVPDLLDEGLWMIDSYLAMQGRDGGVTSGIEYSQHPNVGEPSHLNTLPVYQLAPSPRSNFLYAAATARAARVVAAGGYPTRHSADEYLVSAAAAFAWADLYREDPKPDSKAKTDAARLLASCELLLAGRPEPGKAWLSYVDSLADSQWKIVPEEVAEAAAVFLRLGALHLTEPRRETLARVFYQTTTMSYLAGSSQKSGFGALKNGWAPFGYGKGGAPHVGAHHVLLFPSVIPSDESFPPHIRPERDEYVAAGVSGLSFILGHHPTNRPYVTGLETLDGVDDSWESVHNILHLDSRYAGHRAPVGITVYGAISPVRGGASWPINWPLTNEQSIHPQYELWPEYENLHQFPLWAAMMEYTVWQSVAPTIWFAAELHAR